MDIRNAIKHLALAGSELYLSICTVDAVDEDARTIDCTPIDEGAPLLAVNLQADQSQTVGPVQFPTVGSEVVVGFLNPAVAVVLLCMEVDKTILTIGKTEITVQDSEISIINDKVSVAVDSGTVKIDADGTTLDLNGSKAAVWNGGSETTANATELQRQLNVMSARIDGIIQAISVSPVAPMDGGATYKAAMAATVSALTKENFSQIIDDNIKH